MHICGERSDYTRRPRRNNAASIAPRLYRARGKVAGGSRADDAPCHAEAFRPAPRLGGRGGQPGGAWPSFCWTSGKLATGVEVSAGHGLCAGYRSLRVSLDREVGLWQDGDQAIRPHSSRRAPTARAKAGALNTAKVDQATPNRRRQGMCLRNSGSSFAVKLVDRGI